MDLHVFAVHGIPDVTRGADVAALIASAVAREQRRVEAGDVFVVAQKIVSKAEGAMVRLDDVTPSPMASQWAAANGMAGKEYADVVTSDAAQAMVQGYVDELNNGLNRWETIKRFTILDRDLTVDEGELTPSLKLRRKIVVERYGSEIDLLYR